MVDTSIKYPFSGQSTAVVKGCMYIKFEIGSYCFVMEEHWSSANFLQDSTKVEEISLHEI